MDSDAPAITGSCFQHPEAKALAVCRRCGSFLCRECYFDVILAHCEACTEIVLADIDLPPRPFTKRAKAITALVTTLTFFALFFGLYFQGSTLTKSLLLAAFKAIGIAVLSFQWATSYRSGRLGNRGRALFIEDYRSLLARIKDQLEGHDELLNLSQLFDLDFEALTLSDRLDFVRSFCEAMDEKTEVG